MVRAKRRRTIEASMHRYCHLGLGERRGGREEGREGGREVGGCMRYGQEDGHIYVELKADIPAMERRRKMKGK